MRVITPETAVCETHHHQQQLEPRLLSPGPASPARSLATVPVRTGVSSLTFLTSACLHYSLVSLSQAENKTRRTPGTIQPSL